MSGFRDAIDGLQGLPVNRNIRLIRTSVVLLFQPPCPGDNKPQER